jgi:hypothetical protein
MYDRLGLQQPRLASHQGRRRPRRQFRQEFPPRFVFVHV